MKSTPSTVVSMDLVRYLRMGLRELRRRSTTAPTNSTIYFDDIQVMKSTARAGAAKASMREAGSTRFGSIHSRLDLIQYAPVLVPNMNFLKIQSLKSSWARGDRDV